jgi:CRISPR-associated protein Csb1
MTLTLPPDAPRLLLEAELAPLQGTRLQPTGFPDLGAATYKLPDGTDMLLVESAQSVANRLEAVCWDDARDDVVAALEGMPYVRVLRGGARLTSSIQEAHRLNSAYIENSDGFERIKVALGPTEPVDRRQLARGLLRLDPGSLVHGIFLESITGTMRLARALSGFIEARDARVVTSGGVKHDRVKASTSRADEGGQAKDGFGNVPFHRDEYVAGSITAYFSLDLAQLRGLGLGAEAERFLVALALWKVHRFLETGLRLRSACDLDLAAPVRVARPAGWALPARAALEEVLGASIRALAEAGAFARPPVTEVTYDPAAKGKKQDRAAPAAGAPAKPSRK